MPEVRVRVASPIRALQYTGENADEVVAFITRWWSEENKGIHSEMPTEAGKELVVDAGNWDQAWTLYAPTPESGDWILCNVVSIPPILTNANFLEQYSVE